MSLIGLHVIIIALLERSRVWGEISCYVCGDDMYRFGDSCYQFNTDKTDLATARTNCETTGFHLVYIETSQEQDFLVFTGDTVTPRREYWIGVEKNADGEQVWMDGSAITYSNFETIDDGGECFRLREPKGYTWADRDCDHNKYGHICERENACEENIYWFGESYYQFNTNQTDLSTARRNCETAGFHLVYIETSEEQDFLESTGDTITPQSQYWIGIEKNAGGEQVWMDGSTLTYSNFGSIDEGGECFRLTNSYIWADRVCDYEFGYICESERTYSFGNSCYRFRTDRTDLTTAKTFCEAKGFHLVYIETTEEQRFLASTVDIVTPELDFWIGVEKNADNEHVWMDGSAITYSNFAEIKRGGECFRIRNDDYTWEDHQCDHTHYGYICEREGACSEEVVTHISTTPDDSARTTTGVTSSTESSTITQVTSALERKISTIVTTPKTFETTSTIASSTPTEPSTARVLIASPTTDKVPGTISTTVTTLETFETTSKASSTPTEPSIASPTTDKVPATTTVAQPTKMESSTTVTTQETYSSTNFPLISTTAQLSSTISSPPVTTTAQLSSTQSVTKKTEQTSVVPSFTASTITDSKTSFRPSETVTTAAPTKRSLMSRKFRLLSRNTKLADSSVSLTTTARSLLRCASSCNDAGTCSHFSYAPSSSKCTLGYITADDSNNFVEERGPASYAAH